MVVICFPTFGTIFWAFVKTMYMSYYRNKEKYDPEHSGSRNKVGPKDINDPFFDTDLKDKSAAERANNRENDPSVHKDYDGSRNSGGSKSSAENAEN
jgi:hypothetical protein